MSDKEESANLVVEIAKKYGIPPEIFIRYLLGFDFYIDQEEAESPLKDIVTPYIYKPRGNQ
jgi:hypothetical protein